MKKHVGDFVRRYLTCQQVKAVHQRPVRLLQPLEVVEWKWEHVTMDFVTHLPRTSRGHDTVWVIVNRLSKSAHFLAVRMTFTLEEFCRLYMREIVRLHGVLVSIVSDQDPRFTAPFWKSFQRVMGTQLRVLHVSMLRKYTPDPTHVVDWGYLVIDVDGSFKEGPVCIMDSRDQVL